MPKVNYTEKQEAEIVNLYTDGREAGKTNEQVLASINEATGRAVKSVRAKLVSMKVYAVDEKPPAKPKDEGPTKKELQADLARFDVNLDGSDNASKTFFVNLIGFLEAHGIERQPDSE